MNKDIITTRITRTITFEDGAKIGILSNLEREIAKNKTNFMDCGEPKCEPSCFYRGNYGTYQTCTSQKIIKNYEAFQQQEYQSQCG